VGDAWERLESEVLINTSWEDQQNNAHPFKARGIKDEWLKFVKDRHKDQLDKLEQEIKEKALIFDYKSKIITKLKRWDYAGIFRRASAEPKCGEEKDQKRMDKRVQLAYEFYTDLVKTPFDTELKLT
jgi:hypothetical protein